MKSLLIIILLFCDYIATVKSLQAIKCPLWHVRRDNVCDCGAGIADSVSCDVSGSITVAVRLCMTWDNHSAVVNRCPLPGQVVCSHDGYLGVTNISADTFGPEINNITCKRYNRKGTQCSQCIGGYGPAVFSDGFTCADCNSQYSHLWCLNLLLQLTMVTLMYVVVVLFQIKGTSSPLSVIITYTQICTYVMSLSASVRLTIVCYFGPTLTTIILTIVGMCNLDFFRFVLPPVCISTSLKSINVLLFDYIIALYPILLTFLLYIVIELHDRNCWRIHHLTIPIKKFFNLFRKELNPRRTILNTCITFLLLAYSKLLFTSVSLLFAVRAYNSEGEVVPHSTVLLYDPSISLFHHEHIPYAVLSLCVIVTFILLPPLLLLCYPTRFFKVCLNQCGFKRWDILHLITDVFQGWFKDGTGGSRDFRFVSSLYFLLRLALCGAFMIVLVCSYYHSWYVLGMCHIFLGTFFLISKPYKRNWMNYADGLTIDIIGVMLLVSYHNVFLN